MAKLEDTLATLRNDAERQMNRLQLSYDPHSIEWTVTLGAWQERAPSLEAAAATAAEKISAFRQRQSD